MKRMLLLSFLALAACGGSSSAPPPEDDFFGPTIGLATGTVVIQGEVEPNDSIAMANPVIVPTPSPTDDFVGFQVNGTIKSLTDGVDTFSFTATRTREFSIKLCASTCSGIGQGGSLDVVIAYFDVLDQSGNVLLSSQGDNVVGNYREINIDAGVLYYIMVLAEDTMNAAQTYSLLAVEKII